MDEEVKQGFQADQEQIDGWKKKHGSVFEIEVKGLDGNIRRAYLKKPGRNELSYAGTVAGKDVMKFNQTILEGCWLGGDEDIKTDDELFLGACNVLDHIIETAEASIKKL
jgi:hypothetical protein